MKWLESREPDDWHQVVIDWNWDCGLDVLGWITEQVECDRATAQCVILRAAPEYFIGFADREALQKKEGDVNIKNFDLLISTITKWNSYFYRRSKIASVDPKQLHSERETYRLVEAKYECDELPWRMDDTVFQLLSGREFRHKYQDGWPPEVVKELRSHGLGILGEN